MNIFLEFLRSFFTNVHRFLDSIQFEIAGVNVSFVMILLGFLIASIVVSVFWKGGKS